MTKVTDNSLMTRSALGELVLSAYRAALADDSIGETDDFFAAGGHSLLAVQVIQNIQFATGTDLPVALIFLNPTPAELADVIAGYVPTQ